MHRHARSEAEQSEVVQSDVVAEHSFLRTAISSVQLPRRHARAVISSAGVASKARSSSDFERTVASKPCRSGIYRANAVPAEQNRAFGVPEAAGSRGIQRPLRYRDRVRKFRYRCFFNNFFFIGCSFIFISFRRHWSGLDDIILRVCFA